MRRRHLALLGLVTAVGTAISPATAQAHTAGSAPGWPDRTGAHAVLVTPAECTALRLHLGKAALNCAHIFTFHLAGHRPAGAWTLSPPARRPGPAADSSTYDTGFVLACSDANCDLSRLTSWEAQDSFAVTFINNVGVWDNWHNCYPYGDLGPGITWCGTWHNGWTVMEEGDNFGNNGYARVAINTYGKITLLAGSSYAYLYACVGPPGSCTYP